MTDPATSKSGDAFRIPTHGVLPRKASSAQKNHIAHDGEGGDTRDRARTEALE
jgi:hypothetical protein